MATAQTASPRKLRDDSSNDSWELQQIRALLDDDEWDAQSELLARADAAHQEPERRRHPAMTPTRKPNPPVDWSHPNDTATSLQRALRKATPQSSLQRALEQEAKNVDQKLPAVGTDNRNSHPNDKKQPEEQLDPEQERWNLEKQRQTEEDGMLRSRAGKAWRFVEEVLKLHASLRNNSTTADPPNATTEISPAATDDMVYMTERLLRTQDNFCRTGRPAQVDLGYHYTKSANLPSIATTGLLSSHERSRRDITPAKYHGSRYGDGIYTAPDPYRFHGYYGDIGFLVARLKGTSSVSPAGHDYECHNNSVTKYSSSGGREYLTVLQKSSQCIPLIQFGADWIDPDDDDDDHPGNQRILEYHAKLQTLIDTYFNQGRAAAPSSAAGIVARGTSSKSAHAANAFSFGTASRSTSGHAGLFSPFGSTNHPSTTTTVALGAPQPSFGATAPSSPFGQPFGAPSGSASVSHPFGTTSQFSPPSSTTPFGSAPSAPATASSPFSFSNGAAPSSSPNKNSVSLFGSTSNRPTTSLAAAAPSSGLSFGAPSSNQDNNPMPLFGSASNRHILGSATAAQSSGFSFGAATSSQNIKPVSWFGSTTPKTTAGATVFSGFGSNFSAGSASAAQHFSMPTSTSSEFCSAFGTAPSSGAADFSVGNASSHNVKPLPFTFGSTSASSASFAFSVAPTATPSASGAQTTCTGSTGLLSTNQPRAPNNSASFSFGQALFGSTKHNTQANTGSSSADSVSLVNPSQSFGQPLTFSNATSGAQANGSTGMFGFGQQQSGVPGLFDANQAQAPSSTAVFSLVPAQFGSPTHSMQAQTGSSASDNASSVNHPPSQPSTFSFSHTAAAFGTTGTGTDTHQSASTNRAPLSFGMTANAGSRSNDVPLASNEPPPSSGSSAPASFGPSPPANNAFQFGS